MTTKRLLQQAWVLLSNPSMSLEDIEQAKKNITEVLLSDYSEEE